MGPAKARSFRRLLESKRFDPKILMELRGVPWDLSGKENEKVEMLPLVAGPDAQGLPIVPTMSQRMPPKPMAKQFRCMYITRADVSQYGGTDGCRGCTEVYIGGKTTTPHSDACRIRMMKLLEGDDERRERLRKRVRSDAVDPGPAGGPAGSGSRE